MRALILANGDRPSEALLHELRRDADLFIAADGAANGLDAIGLSPDVVLGDFNSLSADVAARTAPESLVAAEDQNASDLEKAILYAQDRGAARVTIAGYAGGRIDHALVSVALLVRYHRSLDITLVDDLGSVRACSTELALAGKPGDTVSLIAFADALGVSTEGLRWPLERAALGPGSRGVSNVMTGSQARVVVASGVVLVCHLPPQTE